MELSDSLASALGQFKYLPCFFLRKFLRYASTFLVALCVAWGCSPAWCCACCACFILLCFYYYRNKKYLTVLFFMVEVALACCVDARPLFERYEDFIKVKGCVRLMCRVSRVLL